MSRAAIYDAIVNESLLTDLGFDKSSVLVNYDGDQRPNDTMFMVLTWNQDSEGLRGDDICFIPIKSLTIWVHVYKQFSTDFLRIDNVLNILDAVLGSMIDVGGTDGVTLSQAIPGIRSRDLKDDAYQTICRSSSYKILDRVTASV